MPCSTKVPHGEQTNARMTFKEPMVTARGTQQQQQHHHHHRGLAVVRSAHVGLLLLTLVVKLGQQVRHEGFQGPSLADEGDWLRGWRLNGLLYRSQSLEVMWSVEDRLHVIFSTDCTSFQHWQALLLLESAARVGQRGAITRIVSGCEKVKSLTAEPQLSPIKIQADHAAMEEYFTSFKFHLHFVPDMTAVGNSTDKAYKFANKAHTLHHWLDVLEGGTMWDMGGNPDDHDVIITSIDPDFIFLKPFGPKELQITTTTTIATTTATTIAEGISSQATIRRLHGYPRGQSYGLGLGWLKFDLAKICGPDSPCTKVNASEADLYYNVGPPYSLHRADWLTLLDVWTSFIPQVYDDYPTVDGPNKDPTRHYCEMYAYAMAAAHLGLKHTMLQGELVGCMVHWPAQHMASLGVTHTCGKTPILGPDLPTFVHYCQRYEEAGWIFYKRMVPHDIVPSCGPHVLEVPPPELFSSTKEDPFLVCLLIEAVNTAARQYRVAACGEDDPQLIHDVRLIEGGGSRRPNAVVAREGRVEDQRERAAA